MESLDEAEAKASLKECVQVAVNIRPLITKELLMGGTDCVTVVPGEPQVCVTRLHLMFIFFSFPFFLYISLPQ